MALAQPAARLWNVDGLALSRRYHHFGISIVRGWHLSASTARLRTRWFHTVNEDCNRPTRNTFPSALSTRSSPRFCSTITEMSAPPPVITRADDEYRLPTNVKPKHYDLTVKTDLEKLEFEGFVKISLDIHRETSVIKLNVSDLQIGTAKLYSNDSGTEQELAPGSLDSASERITFQLPTTLLAGSQAELTLPFSAKLSGSMAGYYRSSYEVDGKQKFYALTQFEPTSARKAFPCWDEPLLKATFAITLISREGTVNLSNMPAKSEELYSSSGNHELSDLLPSLKNEDGKWKITHFETTPLMSSYIVAYANGYFEHLESSVVSPLSGKTIPLRIYATADNIHQAQFALDIKRSVLPLYEKVFDVAYPLPKLDTLVASDFDAGAMENWGLITGRTSAFLLNPAKADLQAKKRILGVQSHEVAHMWFGNITTMKWWNYLYLNEGFATLMGEVIIADKVFPEWKVDSEFITDHLNRALSLDAKPSSHPIEVECPDANHINQIFDSLSYSKAASGGSVLRMLSNYVGEERFLKGVSIYLKKKLYGNSVTNDLWDGIREATDLDIVRLMDNWITKIGFPVLTVTEIPTGIHVRQDRFLETGLAESKDNATIWNVPLGIISVNADGKVVHNKEAVLGEREKTFDLDTSKPFKLNAGTTGVYRVLYTPDRLAKIGTEAASSQSIFSLGDRIGLVNDAMELSKAGLAKLSSALTLVDKLKNEKEHLVWDGIALNLSGLVSIWWEHPELIDELNAFRRELFVPIVGRLGYEYSDKDSPDTSLLRTCAISQAAFAKDEGVMKELKSRFAHFVETGDDSKIPADLQRAIFTTAVVAGGRKEYEAVIKIHDKPKTPTSRIAAMVAMGATTDPELLRETFDFIGTKARDQDVVYFFRGLASNPDARRPLAKYFKENYDVLYKRFEGNFMLQYLVELSMGTFSSGKDYLDIVEYFKDKDTSKYRLSLAQALDGIRARTEYIKRSSADLADWFKGRK